jgi:hypothetical protein
MKASLPHLGGTNEKPYRTLHPVTHDASENCNDWSTNGQSVVGPTAMVRDFCFVTKNCEDPLRLGMANTARP